MARWKRISLELSSTWPGTVLLRFEAADGTATMVEVDPDDLAMIRPLRAGTECCGALIDTITHRAPSWYTCAKCGEPVTITGKRLEDPDLLAET